MTPTTIPGEFGINSRIQNNSETFRYNGTCNVNDNGTVCDGRIPSMVEFESTKVETNLDTVSTRVGNHEPIQTLKDDLEQIYSQKDERDPICNLKDEIAVSLENQDWNIQEPIDQSSSNPTSSFPFYKQLQFNNNLNSIVLNFHINIEQDEIWDYKCLIKVNRNQELIEPWFPVILDRNGYRLHQCNAWVFNGLDEYWNGLKSFLEYQSSIFQS